MGAEPVLCGSKYFEHELGNRVNPLLSACGQNLRKLLGCVAKHPSSASRRLSGFFRGG